jgi:hypothetical protein
MYINEFAQHSLLFVIKVEAGLQILQFFSPQLEHFDFLDDFHQLGHLRTDG